jgi:hypothetical protein
MKKVALALIVGLFCGTAALAAAKHAPMTANQSAADVFFTGRYMVFTVLSLFGTLTGGALFLAQVAEKKRMRGEREAYEKQMAAFRKSLRDGGRR